MAYPSIFARIQIEDGPIWDTYEQFGFIYIESESRTAAPEKKLETTTYAEQEGENVDPRTVDDVFDYKVKFLIETPNTDWGNANTKIRAFNNRIRDINETTKIKTIKRVTLYNDYKRVKIVGIPEIIAEPTDFYRDRNGNALDCVLFELTIHVDKPSLCDFALDSNKDQSKVVTVNFDNNSGYENEENIDKVTLDGVSIVFSKGSHSSYAPRFWKNDPSLRAYSGNTMYVDGGSHLIQKIEFTTIIGTTLHITSSVGNIASRTWSGNNYYVPFEFTETNRITSIKITLR